MLVEADSGIRVNGYTYSARATDAKVNIVCRYTSFVNIASSPYLVKPAEVREDMNNHGELASGFLIDLFTDDGFTEESKLNSNSEVLIGGMMYTEITWSVAGSAASLVNFNLVSCDILSGPYSVEVVSGNCYSRTLSAEMLQNGWIVPERTRFKFRTFTTSTTATNEALQIKCVLQMCVKAEDSCLINSKTEQCPNKGLSYDYTPTGRVDGVAFSGDEVSDISSDEPAEVPASEVVIEGNNLNDVTEEQPIGLPPGAVPPSKSNQSVEVSNLENDEPEATSLPETTVPPLTLTPDSEIDLSAPGLPPGSVPDQVADQVVQEPLPETSSDDETSEDEVAGLTRMSRRLC